MSENSKIKNLALPHFPTRFQAVVWRNWNLVPVDRLAKVLHASADTVFQSAQALGLEYRPEEWKLWEKRGYQTIIRRNWDLLDREQLLELLSWSGDRLDFVLKEEDFFYYKLGLFKPECEKVYYRPLTEAEARQTRRIAETVSNALKKAPLTDVPFGFLNRYGNVKAIPAAPAGELRMIYSYSALYGDPLMDDELDSYPEGLLHDYAACGINAVWLPGILYTLVPWLGENEPCSRNWRKRQDNLRKLTDRAARYGIRVILYLNEPRSMPAAFFERHPDWKGSPDESGENFALCTSVPEVLAMLADGVKTLFRAVPELGGVFTITMSENLTHCKSRGGSCCRCGSRSADELAAEVNDVIFRAMHETAPQARLLAYSWGWKNPDAVIARLDPGITVLSVSETGVEFDCFGYRGDVHDYSISKPGPGGKAKAVWKSALGHGLATAAKVQINNTWELSAVPYIPVPDLIEEHLTHLREAGVRDLMLSWTLGGYPGGNIELLSEGRKAVARRKYGTGADRVLQAWSIFSQAFHRYFPNNNVATLYFAPQNFGPMNLLYAAPTGRDATMIGFPYDDLDTWRGVKGNAAAAPLENPYPAEVFEEAFRLLSEQWREGMKLLDGPAPAGADEAEWTELQDIVTACYCHFRTTYNQIRWVRKRNDPAILREERELAETMLRLLRRDSRFGYEASNHYLYTENDFLEKIINCDHLSV